MSTMPPAFRFALVLATTGAIAAAAALLFVGAMRSNRPASPPGGAPGTDSSAANPPAPPEAFDGMRVPAFALTDHTGAPIDESALDGAVTVLDFFFTSCPLACPGMTARMKFIAEALEGTPVRLASISVDGATDTPERLRAYAETNGLDLSRWTLMTGPQDGVRAVLEGGLNWTIRVDESMRIPVEGGGETTNVIHPTRLALVGPDRSVDYAASFTRQDEIELLIDRARALVGDQ